MTPPKLETMSLGKVFTRGAAQTVALQDVTVSISEGEFTSIVGASGCGKTTFLRLINGLISPTSGRVTVNGHTVAKPGREIAFVFQNDGLLPWRTVLSNAYLGPEMQRQEMGPIRKATSATLRLVGLGGFDQHYPHEMSGGMRQRVNIARALMVGADVLLMDEPFAALDSQTREIMQAELTRIWAQTRKTVLLVTHQIDEAVYLSDRVLIFTARPGRLKQEVVIDLPRPRDLSIKRTVEFIRYTDLIWRAIEEEVREGIGLETRAARAVSA